MTDEYHKLSSIHTWGCESSDIDIFIYTSDKFAEVESLWQDEDGVYIEKYNDNQELRKYYLYIKEVKDD